MFRQLVLLLVLLAAPAQAVGVDPKLPDPAQETRARAISRELRCLVCQNQTIADSNAELAADLRGQIRDQIAQGKSDAQIVDFMVERYGDFVLYRPPVKGTTLFLWFGPLVLLFAGGCGLFVYLRKRRGAGESDALSEDERNKARMLLADESESESK